MAAKQYQTYTTTEQQAYIHGNTVRRTQAVPVPAPEQESVIREKSPEELQKERERKYYARRNVARATAIDLPYLIFSTAAVVLCGVVCVLFLQLKSSITTQMSAIASTQTAITNLKADNDTLEARLASTVTLDEVKERAAELGLVYPSEDQIIYYSVESNDYMTQYANVSSK